MNILSNRHGLSSDQIAAVHLDIARSYGNSARYEESLQSLKKVVEATSDSLILSKAFRVKAQNLVRLQRMKEAALAVRLANCYRPKVGDLKEVAVCSNLLGVVSAFTGDYADAFRHLYRSLLIYEMTKDSEGRGTALMNLGVNYYKFCDYTMAAKYFNMAKMHPLENHGRRSLLANCALAYAHLDSSSHALLSLKELCSGDFNLSRQDSINALYAYGIIHQKRFSYDSARYFFERSLSLSKSSNDLRFKAENSVSLATIDLILKDFSHASRLLDEAEAAAATNSNEDILLRIYEQKSFLARLTGDEMEQFRAHDQYIRKKSELYNAHLLPIVAASKARFYEREYQDAIALHREVLNENLQQGLHLKILAYMEATIIFLSVAMITLLAASFITRRAHAIRLEATIKKRIRFAYKKVSDRERLIEECNLLLTLSEEMLLEAARKVRDKNRSIKKVVR
jgi:tetratricopeptide (TPR) repeat protein